MKRISYTESVLHLISLAQYFIDLERLLKGHSVIPNITTTSELLHWSTLVIYLKTNIGHTSFNSHIHLSILTYILRFSHTSFNSHIHPSILTYILQYSHTSFSTHIRKEANIYDLSLLLFTLYILFIGVRSSKRPRKVQ